MRAATGTSCTGVSCLPLEMNWHRCDTAVSVVRDAFQLQHFAKERHQPVLRTWHGRDARVTIGSRLAGVLGMNFVRDGTRIMKHFQKSMRVDRFVLLKINLPIAANQHHRKAINFRRKPLPQ
jgi:hypothetical protein